MPTLRVLDVAPATPRSRIVQLGLAGAPLEYRAGQAVLVGRVGQPVRKPYSLALAPHEAHGSGRLELLVGLDAEGSPGSHLDELARGMDLDVTGPVGSFVFPEQ